MPNKTFNHLIIITAIAILLNTFKVKSQVIITPNIQYNSFDFSLGAMLGYQYIQHTFAANANFGFKYYEISLFYRYFFLKNKPFNILLSGKAGIVNGKNVLFYPGLELTYGIFELGLRPSTGSIITIEPRLRLMLWKKD